MLVGLDFALLIGLIAGLITFVPYIGSMTGLVIATSVAIAQFWPDWKRIVIVIAIFLVGQFVEGNIISPKFVGERVGLHPVWMMFAMFAFGYLFGFVGLLIAVPLAAAIAVLFRFGLRQYLASPFYTGEAELTAMAPRQTAPRQMAPRQLALALDHAESLAREDFLSGPSNAAALELIDTWPAWPRRMVVLAGPEGSGKSHLAAVWALIAGARLVAARALEQAGCRRRS